MWGILGLILTFMQFQIISESLTFKVKRVIVSFDLLILIKFALDYSYPKRIRLQSKTTEQGLSSSLYFVLKSLEIVCLSLRTKYSKWA
jgi:hypothetical protein